MYFITYVLSYLLQSAKNKIIKIDNFNILELCCITFRYLAIDINHNILEIY